MNEESVKNNIIIPFLFSIGFGENNISYEDNFTIRLGKNVVSKKDYISGRLDILVRLDNVPFMLWEMKKERLEITNEEINQAISYARLTEQITPYTIVCNGTETRIFNTFSKEEISKEIINGNINRIDLNETIKYRMEALSEIICYSKNNLTKFLKKINDRELARLRNNKYIPEIYVQRQDVHDLFNDFLSNDKKVFLIIGESGVGKTNTMCNLAENNMVNSLVLFYNGCFINNSIVSQISDDFSFSFDEQLYNRQLLNRINVLAKNEKCCFVIFIDAIDELAINNPTTELDKLLNIVDEFSNIKICLSCKKSFIKDFEEKNGVFSKLKNIEKTTIEINHFNDLEMTQLIQKYKKFYNVVVKENIIQDIKKYCNNGFLLRIIFEVNKNKEINKKFENIEIMEKYLQTISRNYNINIKDLNYTLEVLAELFINEEDDWPRFLIEEYKVENVLRSNNSPITIEELIKVNILQRYSSDKTNYIDFYFKPVSYYVITILYGKLNIVEGNDFIQPLFKLNNNRRGKEALEWYDNYINISQLNDINRFKKEYGNMIINQYREIVNRHFSSIKDRFELNEDINNIGIALDSNTSCVINIYGFYKKINSSDDVRLIDFKEDNFLLKNNMNSYTSTMSKINITDTVKKRVREIIKDRYLCEKKCKYLNIEYILNMLFLFGKIYGFKYEYERINFISNFNKLLPLNLPKLAKEIILFNIKVLKNIDELDKNIDDEEYYQDLVSGNINIPECNFTISGKGKVPIYAFVNRINEFIDTFNTTTIDESHILIPNKLNKTHKSKWILDIIIETYTADELRKYLEDLLLKCVEEYILIVEENFPTLMKKMPYYNLFKNGVSIELYLYKKKQPFYGSYSKKIFWCYNDKREIKVYICDEKNVPKESKNRWLYVITGNATDLFYNDLGPEIYRNMVLSNMIYELLEDDIKNVFDNNENLFLE